MLSATAGSRGFKQAVQQAGLYLLEPIMNLEVVVPEEYLGDARLDAYERGEEKGVEG